MSIEVEEIPKQSTTEELKFPKEGVAFSSKSVKLLPKLEPPFP